MFVVPNRGCSRRFNTCPCRSKTDRWLNEIIDSFCGTFLEEVMKNFATKVQKFLKSEDGPTAVEYAVMMALIIVVCIAGITTVGQNASVSFDKVGTAIGDGNTRGK